MYKRNFPWRTAVGGCQVHPARLYKMGAWRGRLYLGRARAHQQNAPAGQVTRVSPRPGERRLPCCASLAGAGGTPRDRTHGMLPNLVGSRQRWNH